MSQSKGWIGVDLDGTLAEYHGWKGVENIGEPVPAMLERVKAWLAEEREVRIFTARVGHRPSTEAAVANQVIDAWCVKHLGRTLPVTATKDLAMVELWDDRCVQVVPNTGQRVDAMPPEEKPREVSPPPSGRRARGAVLSEAQIKLAAKLLCRMNGPVDPDFVIPSGHFGPGKTHFDVYGQPYVNRIRARLLEQAAIEEATNQPE